MWFGEPFGGLIPGARGAVLAALLRTGTPLTGRQVHALVSERHSLWPVQEALRDLAQLGIVDTQTVGRAGLHRINEDHSAIPHLRALADPVGILRRVIEDVVGSSASSVILFGSIARGEASASSDVDLAIVAPGGWDDRLTVQDAVHARLGNPCDVVVFTPDEFSALARSGEPVVHDILRDGVAILGTMPRVRIDA